MSPGSAASEETPAARFGPVVVWLWASAVVMGAVSGYASGWAAGQADISRGWAVAAGIVAALVGAAPLAGLAAVVRLLASIDGRLASSR